MCEVSHLFPSNLNNCLRLQCSFQRCKTYLSRVAEVVFSKKFNKIALKQYLNLPYVISNAIFDAIILEQCDSPFASFLSHLYCGSQNEQIDAICRILSFKTNFIHKKNIKLFFKVLDIESFAKIKKVIEKEITFKKIPMEDFHRLCQEKVPDIIIIALIYLIKECPFSCSEVDYLCDYYFPEENHCRNNNKLNLKDESLSIIQEALENKDDPDENEATSVGNDIEQLDLFENELSLTMSSISKSNNASRKLSLNDTTNATDDTLKSSYISLFNKSLPSCSILKDNIPTDKVCNVFYASQSQGKNKKCNLIIVNRSLIVEVFNETTNKFECKKVIPLLRTHVVHNDKDNAYRLITQYFPSQREIDFFIGENNNHNVNTFFNRINCINTFKELSNDYEILHEIGRGSYSTVFLAKSKKEKNAGELCAIKQIFKMKEKDYDDILNEIDTLWYLSKAKAKNIVKLIEYYEASNSYFLVTEYIKGVTLNDVSLMSTDKTPVKPKEIITEIAIAIDFLYKNRIVHRDIKPNNIIVTMDKEKKIEVKLIDFGFAKFVPKGNKCTECYGTLAYIAPEILLRAPYSFKADVWSFGVICYQFICNALPFDSMTNLEEIANEIINGEYDEEILVDKCNCENIIKVIKKSLCLDKKKRIKSSQILKFLV